MTRRRNWRRRRYLQKNPQAEPGSGQARASEGGPSHEGAPALESGAEPIAAGGSAPAGTPPVQAPSSNGGAERAVSDSQQRHRRRRHRRRHNHRLEPHQNGSLASSGTGEPSAPSPGAGGPPADAPIASAAPDGSTAGLIPAEQPSQSYGHGNNKMKRRRRRRHRHVRHGASISTHPAGGESTPTDESAEVRAKGRFVGNWWADRWIKMLESLGHSNRLPRGRYYARTGRVFDFRVGPGEVTARVQGSRPQPYSVRIEVAPLDDRAWTRVVEAMAARAMFAAKMLSGEMPQNIGEVFASASVSLFPKLARDIRVNCSCPDSANLCKHAVAVHYILAEAFDQDPFILLHLRGRARDEVIDALTRTRAKLLAAEPSSDAAGQANGAPGAELVAQEEEGPPSSDPFRFYELGHGLEDLTFILEQPPVPHAVLSKLGPPPTHSPAQASAVLASCYGLVSQQALDTAFGRETEPRAEMPIQVPEPTSSFGKSPAITSSQVSLKSIRE
ncbi:MAG: SWIM zinc finger family protein [Candidatus Wallbacteria bacterium]|nr:SWIM zinc finger family protein [Candidatus Wallbacteria bacterium]